MEQKSKDSVAIHDSLIHSKTEQDTLNTVVNTDSEEYFNYENTVLHQKFNDSIYAKFSNTTTEDLFVFSIPEGNINNTESVLKIFTKTGQLIFEKTFITQELVNGYDTINIKNDVDMERYILSKAKEVLSDDIYTEITNIEEDEIFNQTKDNFINYEVFIECRNQKRPLFYLRLGEENNTYFGYSAKLRKAVEIIGCC